MSFELLLRFTDSPFLLFSPIPGIALAFELSTFSLFSRSFRAPSNVRQPLGELPLSVSYLFSPVPFYARLPFFMSGNTVIRRRREIDGKGSLA
jgi:hypothetical protein